MRERRLQGSIPANMWVIASVLLPMWMITWSGPLSQEREIGERRNALVSLPTGINNARFLSRGTLGNPKPMLILGSNKIGAEGRNSWLLRLRSIKPYRRYTSMATKMATRA